MQKSLAELTAFPPHALTAFVEDLNEPLLVTQGNEPQFVVQSLACFERMVRRLRFLEAQLEKQTTADRVIGRRWGRNNVIGFPTTSTQAESRRSFRREADSS